MSRFAVRLLVGVVLVLILIAGAIGGFVWWKISGLKETLVRDLGQKIGAQVQIASLDFDLWKGELHAANISLTNERPSAPWEKGAISQATVKFQLRDIFSPTIPVTVEVSSWNVVLHPRPSDSTSISHLPEDTISNSRAAPSSAPSGRHIKVTQLSAQDGSVDIHLSDGKLVQFHGASFTANDNGIGVWTTQLHLSSILAGSLQTGASTVEIRSEQDKISFTNLRVTCDQGFVTGEGEVSLESSHQAQFNLKATNVPVSMLVSVDWQMKLSGLVNGDLAYSGNDQGGSAKGHISVNQAKFNVLPLMGKVTSLVGLPDISNVELDKATSDFEWKESTLHLTNLDIRKNDVSRVAGSVDIDSASQIDGKFKLGLPSSVTNKWPDLQTKVFPVQLEDYNWADVHVTGTPDQLKEDLTPRLLAVSVQEGSSLLDQAKQKATDLLKSFMGN